MTPRSLGSVLATAVSALVFGFIATSLTFGPVDQLLLNASHNTCEEFYKIEDNGYWKCTQIARLQSKRRVESIGFPLLVINSIVAAVVIRKQAGKVKGDQNK
jgi:hypothetical protein